MDVDQGDTSYCRLFYLLKGAQAGCLRVQCLLEQGVVTYMSCVEAFATGIKIESSDQSPFGGQSMDQGDLRTAKNRKIKNA